MSERIQVATRKGLFTLGRGQTGQWSIANVAFLGLPVTMTLVDPRNGFAYAALNLEHFGPKLHRSCDDGQSWAEMEVPRYPAGETVPHRMAEGGGEPDASPPQKPASLAEIWSLETGGADEPGLLWAGTIPGGLFRSPDDGQTWELIEPLWNRPERQQWFGGGKDDPGLHSICVDPRDPKHLSVAISCGGIWVTHDAGNSWSCQSDGLRADYMPPDQQFNPVIQDPHRMVQCPASADHLWIQHHNGIFASDDGGTAWREIENVAPSSFGFGVAVHPHDPRTAWFVPGVKDEIRVPVEGRLVVTKTIDGGQTFSQSTNGLPQQHAYDIVLRHALDIDATGDVLAMGSTTGNLWITEDGGNRWQSFSTHLPPIYAVRFDPVQRNS